MIASWGYFLFPSANAFAPARPRGSGTLVTVPGAALATQSRGSRSMRLNMLNFW